MVTPDNDDGRNTLREFAAKIGNELNNPLAAIQAAHEFIRRHAQSGAPLAGNGKINAMLAAIDGELANARRLVADLVDLSTERPIIRTSFVLRDVVATVARELKRPPEVTFTNAVPDTLRTISADRERLSRALRRIAQNGVEAIPAGRRGEVRVTARIDDAEAIIEIVDDGEGVPDGISDRIAEVLFSTKVKGAGLGLTIAKALIAEQGGDLRWTSSVGEGSTFTVTLPGA